MMARQILEQRPKNNIINKNFIYLFIYLFTKCIIRNRLGRRCEVSCVVVDQLTKKVITDSCIAKSGMQL